MADVEFTLKSHRVTLTIQKWEDASDVEPSYHLDEVWIHVTGVPQAWRHYLGFWALGSVIGVTLEVDMFTYRKKGVVRLLVGMMSREPLPLTTDIVFGTKGYDITFAIEEENFLPAAPLVVLDDPHNDGGDGANKEFGRADKSPEHAHKKQKHKETKGASSSHSNSGVGGDIPMLDAVVCSVSDPGKGPMPIALKDLPILHKIALTPMCTHRLARSRKDLKLQKQTADHPSAASPILSVSVSGAVGLAKATTGGESALVNYPEAIQTSLSSKDAGPEALTVLDIQNMSNTPGKITPSSNDNSKVPTASFFSHESSSTPLLYEKAHSVVFQGRNISKWQGHQKPVEVEHTSGSVYAEKKVSKNPSTPSIISSNDLANDGVMQQKKLETPVERSQLSLGRGEQFSPGIGSNLFLYNNQLNSPAYIRRSSRLNSLLADGSHPVDEDSTLKAMKKKSRRNLDGTLSGMKGDTKRLQPCSSPPAHHIQPCMDKTQPLPSISSLTNISCANRLGNIGFFLGCNESAVNVSVNVLKIDLQWLKNLQTRQPVRI
ncbi:hypothetical protein BS78_02G279800 [Paspalum vaginatum]|nr:hypothetical protein BS78_02G279800 [Paspalum vaginatum]